MSLICMIIVAVIVNLSFWRYPILGKAIQYIDRFPRFPIQPKPK